MTAVLRPRAVAGEGLWSRLDQRGRVALLLLVAAGVAFMGAQGPTLARALVGVFGLVIFVFIAFANRDSALVMVVLWLVLLGFIRRFLIPFSGWSEQDPLLMISPAAAVTFLLASRGTGLRAPRSALASLALILTLWSALQVFNPNEGSLVVALQGAMFWVVPMLWFFVGRTLTTDQHQRIINTVFWVAIAVTAHGLFQTFFDLLPFEYTWLAESGQGPAIFIGGFKVRPFSTLTSPQEYGQFMSFALLVIWAKILHFPGAGDPRHRHWLVVFFLVAGTALFYQGGRANLVFFLLALAVTTVVRTRSPLMFLVIAMAGVALVSYTGSQDVASTGTVQEVDKSGAIARHQLSGLTNPSQSTLPEHLRRIEEAVGQGIRQPFGIGVSQKSIAGAKFRNDSGEAASAENDIAHTLQSLGTPAGFAYIGFIGAAHIAAVRLQRRRPSVMHLAWLGMLVAATTQIWSGQLYATSTILFLALGGLARESGELLEADQAARLAPRAPSPRLVGADHG